MQNICLNRNKQECKELDKGSNLFDGMVVCKRQDSMDLYKFEIGDIYWKRDTLNIMTVFPPTLNPLYLKLELMMTERESLIDDSCRTKSCQDAVTCQIPVFCLDCPRVRYSI